MALAVLLASTRKAEAISIVVNDPQATQPSINDLGEIIYGRNQQIFSTTRGLLVGGGVDFSNLGISNSGEVVYADGTSTSQVISTVSGTLVTSRSFGPTISPTTGEVAYVGIVGLTATAQIFSTVQGQISFVDDITERVGVADVNDSGEIVYELRDLLSPFTRIFSTTRGFLTPTDTNAIQPAINNLGEVVWSGFDSFGRQQIFSNIRGQLTFFDGVNGFLTADLPDISNDGTVVFRGNLDGVSAIYSVDPIPEPSTMLLLGSGLAGLGLFRRRRKAA